MSYDTVCQFSCNNGYIGSGSQARRCQHNGTWSGQDFTCESTLLYFCDESYFHSRINPRVQCSGNCFQSNGSTIQTGFSIYVQLATETNLGLFRDAESKIRKAFLDEFTKKCFV